ncbi:unnamed protein product [Polarella glacialis]|uniref:Ubiquitin-like domain-containing protein n=1 Tax=Polarella glacialis TaxID=89957 RepID=A0A813IRI3_POLGL|nr:unnamed protein product [Polarella glacialis]
MPSTATPLAPSAVGAANSEAVGATNLEARVQDSLTMEIFVTSVSGETFRLDANSSDSVVHIKEALESLSGIPCLQQILSFEGAVLKDNSKLQAYNIQAGSELMLVRICSFDVTLLCRLPCVVQATSADTVLSLKRKIFEQMKIPPDQMILVGHGQGRLDDNCSLRDYDIDGDCKVSIVFKLPGGNCINVNMPSGGTLPFAFDLGKDTVGGLKDLIFDRKGIPQDKQVLVFAGRHLGDDTARLTDMGVRPDNTLQLQLAPMCSIM